jgi:hypothetical protein
MTIIRTCVATALAAMCVALAWQGPLVLELRSRTGWLADAQRAVLMVDTDDFRGWKSLQTEAALAARSTSIGWSSDAINSPAASLERQRNALLLGFLVRIPPGLPPDLRVGVPVGPTGIDQGTDPLRHRFTAAWSGFLRVWLVLLLGVVIVPMSLTRMMSARCQRGFGIGFAGLSPPPTWSLMLVAATAAFILSWGRFYREYLWGWPAPQWADAVIIGSGVFGFLVLPRLIHSLLSARDRAAATAGLCPVCFYGPFDRAGDQKGSSTRRCPECGAETKRPPPRRRVQRAATWLAMLTPIWLVIVACWWPIKVVGPLVFTYTLFSPVVPHRPETTLGEYLWRWASMRSLGATLDSNGHSGPSWAVPPPDSSINSPLPAIPPSSSGSGTSEESR